MGGCLTERVVSQQHGKLVQMLLLFCFGIRRGRRERMKAVLVLAPIDRHGTVSNFRQAGELSSQGGTGGFWHNCAGGPVGLKND